MDGTHLLDFFNLLLLVAPIPFLALFLLRRRDYGASEGQRFALATALPLLLFAFAANARIGLFRDWDAFSLVALPLGIWAGLALSSRREHLADTARAGFVICGAALLHTGLWLGLNADDRMAVARFANALESTPLSPPTRAYGGDPRGTRARQGRG